LNKALFDCSKKLADGMKNHDADEKKIMRDKFERE
jgi:hypothetical protein